MTYPGYKLLVSISALETVCDQANHNLIYLTYAGQYDNGEWSAFYSDSPGEAVVPGGCKRK